MNASMEYMRMEVEKRLSDHIREKMNYESMLNSGVNLVYGSSGRSSEIKILEFDKFIKVNDKY